MYAQKHIELFEKIPFKEFHTNKPLFEEMIALRNKFVRPEKVIYLYECIAREIYDKYDHQFIVRDILSSYDYHDTVSLIHWSVPKKLYIKPKKFNGVLGKAGCNIKTRSPYGLIITAKPGVSRKELEHTIEDFRVFSQTYQPRRDIFTKELEEVPEDHIEHLYMLLSELLEKADFSYIHKGSITLAKEMAEELNNQGIIILTKHKIKLGHDYDEMMQNLKLHKRAMFPEIEHNIEKYREIKRNLKKQRQLVR